MRASNTEAQMQIVFKKNTTDGTAITVESVAQAFKDGLANTGNLFNITVDPDSVQVTGRKTFV